MQFNKYYFIASGITAGGYFCATKDKIFWVIQMIKNRLKEIKLGTFLIDNQEDFAELLEINPQQYNRYEKQLKQSQLETALIITDKLSQLLKDKGIKKNIV